MIIAGLSSAPRVVVLRSTASRLGVTSVAIELNGVWESYNWGVCWRGIGVFGIVSFVSVPDLDA